VAEKRGSGRL